MVRFYVSNHSYPEIREIHSRWTRNLIWWRAFASAVRDWRFWLFVATQVGLLATCIGLGRLLTRSLAGPEVRLWLDLGTLLLASAGWSLLALSWGGDLIRPHLRRVSPIARESCPHCGHLLTGQLRQPESHIRCPECGLSAPRATFEPPYPIPRACRAIRF